MDSMELDEIEDKIKKPKEEADFILKKYYGGKLREDENEWTLVFTKQIKPWEEKLFLYHWCYRELLK